MHVPSSSPQEDIQLLGARRCLYGDGLVPHVMYRVHGQDVSLFVLPGKEREADDLVTLGHRSQIWTQGRHDVRAGLGRRMPAAWSARPIRHARSAVMMPSGLTAEEPIDMQDDMNPADAQSARARTGSRRQEPQKPQSRKAVWLAMGAVALALGLIWVAPGIEPHVDDASGSRGLPR